MDFVDLNVKKTQTKRTTGYLTGGVGVENFILDDEPEPLPLLLAAFGPVQVAAHGGVLSVGRDLRQPAGGRAKLNILCSQIRDCQ